MSGRNKLLEHVIRFYSCQHTENPRLSRNVLQLAGKCSVSCPVERARSDQIRSLDAKARLIVQPLYQLTHPSECAAR